MGNLFAAIFLALVAAAVFIQRRRLAHMQALTLGGSIRPGCVIVEAIVLLLIAVIFAIVHFSGVS